MENPLPESAKKSLRLSDQRWVDTAGTVFTGLQLAKDTDPDQFLMTPLKRALWLRGRKFTRIR